jgi:hypothetical protein
MIFNVSELDLIDFEQVKETSKETVRKSIDGSKTFVKWEGKAIPLSVQLLTTKEGEYTYDEILTILQTPEWLLKTNFYTAVQTYQTTLSRQV